MNTEKLLRCKTDNAYHMKIVAELVSNIVKTSFWTINNNGIFLSMVDQPRKTMMNIKLSACEFNFFSFKGNEDINIGMNSNHFFKMLKSIKKKDSVELFIDKDIKNVLNIKTIPKDKNRETISSINIQQVQNLDINYPSEYKSSIIIPSVDFQKMLKDLNMIGSDKIEINVKKGVINFTANSDGILKRVVTFGDERDDEFENQSVFESSQLDRVIKIAALGEQIHVYPSSETLPIKLKTRIGSIGEMSIFIKSDEIIQSERFNK